MINVTSNLEDSDLFIFTTIQKLESCNAIANVFIKTEMVTKSSTFPFLSE